MVGKRRPGARFTWKEERQVIAMAANGATTSEIKIQNVRQDDRAEGQSARNFNR